MKRKIFALVRAIENTEHSVFCWTGLSQGWDGEKQGERASESMQQHMQMDAS